LEAEAADSKPGILLEQFQSNLKGWSGESARDPDFIFNETQMFLQLIGKECVRTLAQLTAIAVEHLLRVAESYFIDLNLPQTLQTENERWNQQEQQQQEVKQDETQWKKEIIDKATYVHLLSLALCHKINKMSSDFIDCLQSVSSHAQSTLKSLPTGDTSSIKKFVELIENQMYGQINSLHLETGEGVSNVHESESHLIPICTYLLLVSPPNNPL